jgi:hypothetical protein
MTGIVGSLASPAKRHSKLSTPSEAVFSLK